MVDSAAAPSVWIPVSSYCACAGMASTDSRPVARRAWGRRFRRGAAARSAAVLCCREVEGEEVAAGSAAWIRVFIWAKLCSVRNTQTARMVSAIRMQVNTLPDCLLFRNVVFRNGMVQPSSRPSMLPSLAVVCGRRNRMLCLWFQTASCAVSPACFGPRVLYSLLPAPDGRLRFPRRQLQTVIDASFRAPTTGYRVLDGECGGRVAGFRRPVPLSPPVAA